MIAHNEEKFLELYDNLNQEQRKAVDTIEGPVMVIAGPGTGKTQILTLRIANILRKTDVPADSILALTFTESAVHSMRERLVSIIGSRAYHVNIYTFHGFANEIIRRFPEEVPRIIGSKVASQAQKIKIIESIVDENTFEFLAPYGDPYFYVQSILQSISHLKREALSVADYKELIEAKNKLFEDIPDKVHEKGKYAGTMKTAYQTILKKIGKNRELAMVYELYEQKLRKEKIYDYEDMILEIIKAFEKNPSFRLIVQEEFQYILADEHQDANNSQNKILELLSDFHDNPNLFIVGDEKQAVFRFQGASLENFLYFQKRFPESVVITLTSNYRSTQAILDTAFSLMPPNENLQVERPRLISGSKDKALIKPHIISLGLESTEADWIADSIQKQISQGISPRSIAIIFRENKDAISIAKSLSMRNIPFSVIADQDVFTDTIVYKLYSIILLIDSFQNDTLLAQILMYDFFSIDIISLAKIFKYSEENQIALFDLLSQTDLIQQIAPKDYAHIAHVFSILKSLAEEAKNNYCLEVIDSIIQKTGILTPALRSTYSRDTLKKLDRFISEAVRVSESSIHFLTRDFIEYLETLKKYGISLESKTSIREEQSVSLLTAHRSKGMEFDRVYITGASDGHWGNKRTISHFDLALSEVGEPIISLNEDPLDDERRLFYVAITRAKESVTITYPTISLTGKLLLPSVFIEELNQDLIIRETVDVGNPEILVRSDFGLAQTVLKPRSINDPEYIRNLFLERGISVTALNNYLKCPFNFFFVNLIRIPQLPEYSQIYGTVWHKVLAYIGSKEIRGEPVSSDEVVSFFDALVKKTPLSDLNQKRMRERGNQSIISFLKEYMPESNVRQMLAVEKNISGVFIPYIDDKGDAIPILLRGTLDAIQYLDDSSVKVVDYKTGTYKTRNEILGKTRSADGNYLRQLQFYKILFDGSEYASGRKMIEGELIFVESGEKGKIKKENFSVSDDDTVAIKNIIQGMANDVLQLNFVNKGCGEDDCKWCRLAKDVFVAE